MGRLDPSLTEQRWVIWRLGGPGCQADGGIDWATNPGPKLLCPPPKSSRPDHGPNRV